MTPTADWLANSLRSAAHRVAGERLDRLRRLQRPDRDGGFLFRGQRIEDTNREAADPAGDFRRAKDGRVGRRRKEAVVRNVGAELRRSPDPPRVEKARAAAVVAVHIEAEDARAFDEERTPLRKERFKGAEIDDRRVGFHLPEVGVDRRGQRQRRRDRVLHVEADRRARVHALDERVAVLGLGRQIADRVRKELEPPRRARELEAVQLAELRDDAVGALRDERPGRRLVVACNLSRERQAEDRFRRGWKTQLRERNAELRAPPVGPARDDHVPDRVPSLILVAVVEVVLVLLHSRRIHRELVRGPLVVIGVDQHRHPVGWRV